MPEPPINDTTIYPYNGTTVDNDSGGDIRALRDTTSAADTTQNVAYTSDNDGTHRCWDPATTALATVRNAATTLYRTGWAIPVADFTPADSRCVAVLAAQTVTVTANMTHAWAGQLIQGGPSSQLTASLWKYNPTSNAGTLIAGATGASTTWSNLGEENVYKAVTAAITVAALAEFDVAEILYLQIGILLGTIHPQLLGGAQSYTSTLDLNGSTVVFGGTSLRVRCRDAQTCPGVGVPAKILARARVTRTPPGVGVASKQLIVVQKTHTVDAVGVPASTRRTRASRSVDAIGTGSRLVTAGLVRAATAVGTAARTLARVRTTRPVDAVNVPAGDRVWQAYREGTVDVEAVPGFERAVIFTRVSQVDAEVAASARVDLPIDDLPDSGEAAVIKKIFPVFD